MRRWRHSWVMAVLLVATTTAAAQPSAPGSPQPEQRDPEALFQRACERLIHLEGKFDLLKGLSEIKPAIERDARGKLKGASFTFQRNAIPFGKGGAKARDESQPFVLVAVQVWSGRTPSPAANIHEFQWNGQIYQMWIRAMASNDELVQAVRREVGTPVLELPIGSLTLRVPQTHEAYRKGRALVIEGQAIVHIHRPGPEHFKLTRMKDGQRIALPVAYYRDKLEPPDPRKERSIPALEEVLPYNSLFKGARLIMYGETHDEKNMPGEGESLDLYARPKLEAGVLYRLTWACWPVGASQAIELSCEFELPR